MGDSEASEQQVTIVHRIDDDYRVLAVNGAWGGPTPRGDIRVELFREAAQIPEKYVHRLEGGQLGEQLEPHPTPAFERVVLVGLMLTPEQAENLGVWLQKHARQAIENRGQADQDAHTTH